MYSKTLIPKKRCRRLQKSIQIILSAFIYLNNSRIDIVCIESTCGQFIKSARGHKKLRRKGISHLVARGLPLLLAQRLFSQYFRDANSDAWFLSSVMPIPQAYFSYFRSAPVLCLFNRKRPQ